jgi:hypothetical protein
MPQPEFQPRVQQVDSGAHERYELMCALAAAHELSPEEQRDFGRHLAECDACRAEVASFRHVVDRLAEEQASHDSVPLDEQAHAARFTRFAKAQGLPFSEAAQQALEGDRSRRWQLPVMAYSMAGVVVATVVGSVLLLRSRSPLAPTMPSARTRPAVVQPYVTEADSNANRHRISELETQLSAAQTYARELPVVKAERQAEQNRRARLEWLMAERDREIAQLTLAGSDSQKQLSAAQATIAALSAKNDDLTASLVAEREKANSIVEALRSQKLLTEQEKQLTAATREVRELMGARRLYMIDVYDGENASRANRSFGRVFYTEGKSLIFYAFDLDRIKSSKRLIFAAWGERGKDSSTIKPLGVFNLDDVAQKRWVMKVDDPDGLKSIDAIFVTVESTLGAERPSGQKLLYAYLGGQPNHP